MAARIEIQEKGIDARATVLERRIESSVPKAKVSSLVDVYTVDAKLFEDAEGLKEAASEDGVEPVDDP